MVQESNKNVFQKQPNVESTGLSFECGHTLVIGVCDVLCSQLQNQAIEFQGYNNKPDVQYSEVLRESLSNEFSSLCLRTAVNYFVILYSYKPFLKLHILFNLFLFLCLLLSSALNTTQSLFRRYNQQYNKLCLQIRNGLHLL